MENAITAEILEIALKGLKKLSPTGSTSFAVVESEDPGCILKKIPQLKGKLVINYVNRTIFSSSHSWNFQVNYQRWDAFSGTPIKLTSDTEPIVKLQTSGSFYRSKSFMVNFGEGYSVEVHPQSSDCILEEKEGNFHLTFGSSSFPIEQFLPDKRSIENIVDVIHFISSSLPVERKTVLSDRALLNRIIRHFGVNSPESLTGKLEGIVKTVNRVRDFYLADTDLVRAFSFQTLAQSSKATVNNVKSSVIFNKLFEKVETTEDFYKVCDQLQEMHFKNRGHEKYYYLSLDERTLLEDLMNNMDEGREIMKAAIKRKSTGAFNKIMNDLDFIDIDENLFPLTHKAVHEGDIPLGTFFRKNGESYFVYNDNWDLWEKMLKEHREVAIQIAKSCSGRTTYEKDIMSYFYFTLYELPEYLEQHTGRKWKGVPKLVNTADELEPPKVGETGTSKTRSALTPIVDNEKSEVVVPYVSMRIGGYQTTYCYGLTYSVMKRGFSYMGNTVTKDVEKALNGRDDYGLMFYTLTGSSQGRGYPTFLIIFERLIGTTRVHFHRTHPMRSKGGDYNPIHNWTVGCYKWMIGNVNFERIEAQQGDLAFVKIDEFPEGEPEMVNGYDSHLFAEPVEYLPYAKKDNQNVLGYVRLKKPNAINHTEHMTRNIKDGVYEIRQCRSWEANPKGIWSLRID